MTERRMIVAIGYQHYAIDVGDFAVLMDIASRACQCNQTSYRDPYRPTTGDERNFVTSAILGEFTLDPPPAVLTEIEPAPVPAEPVEREMPF